MDLASAGALAAGVAGFTSSLHCFAMCGPLACAGCARSNRARGQTLIAYHAARAGMYALGGGLFGLLGEQAANVLSVAAPRWLPWVLAALLAASALGVAPAVPRWPWLSKVLVSIQRASAGLAPPLRSGAIGALTALLPCGLLYSVYGASLVAGSFERGAAVAGGFALGGIPALTLAQLHADWIRRLPHGGELLIRRVLPLAAAALLVLRATSTHGCPLCYR